MLRRWIPPALVYYLYRIWTSTWRLRIEEAPSVREALSAGVPLIFAHWHGDEIAIIHLVTRYRIATMTSTSKDGLLVDYLIRRLGGGTSKGSSTRGGTTALKGLVRLCRAGYRASMAVDGPRGPYRKVKPGVFELSKLVKARIVPVGVSCDRAFVFEKSWNKTFLPKPFARVVVALCEAWPVVGKDDPLRSEALLARLETSLEEAHRLADRLLEGAGAEPAHK